MNDYPDPNQYHLPPLPLAGWITSRDTLRSYTRVLSIVRKTFTPRQEHWGHISLFAAANGFTTGPVPAGSLIFEVNLDLTTHQVNLFNNKGQREIISLDGQPASELSAALSGALQAWGLTMNMHTSQIDEPSISSYDREAVERYWQALSQIDAMIKQFRAGLREKTSPVQLWPHHFDLAMLWFSGRLVPGKDTEQAEIADEQMNFGFSTGDETIIEPYFYATAYPMPSGMEQLPPPCWRRLAKPELAWDSNCISYRSQRPRSSRKALECVPLVPRFR